MDHIVDAIRSKPRAVVALVIVWPFRSIAKKFSIFGLFLKRTLTKFNAERSLFGYINSLRNIQSNLLINYYFCWKKCVMFKWFLSFFQGKKFYYRQVELGLTAALSEGGQVINVLESMFEKCSKFILVSKFHNRQCDCEWNE